MGITIIESGLNIKEMKKPNGHCFILAAFLWLGTLLQAQPAQEWARNFNGSSNQLDYGRALQIDANGNSYIAGTVSSLGSGKDIAVIKYNSQGVQQWLATYNGTNNNDDWAYAVVIDSAGNSYVTGFTTTQSSGKDFITVKFDSSGSFQWVQQYDGTGNADDAANHIAIDPWANVSVTGISKGNGTGDDYVTIKYDATGAQLWLARYDGPASGTDDARTITADAQGNVYVSGGSVGLGSDYDFTTIKYDTAGTQQWVALYNGPANAYDLVYYQGSIVVDSLGNVYITGYSTGTDSTLDYATIKYNSLGIQLWAVRFSTEINGTDYADNITIDDSLNVYITGASKNTPNDFDFATVKYDSSGVQQWVVYYNGTGNSWDEAYGVVTDDSLNVYILGRSPGTGTSTDFVTLKYDANGNLIWEMRYPNPGYDWPFVLRYAPDRSLYAGGWTSPSNGMADFCVIKYSQTPLGFGPESNEDNDLHVYPNPTSGKLFFSYSNTTSLMHVIIYDVNGRNVLEAQIDPGSALDIAVLEKGIYIVSAWDEHSRYIYTSKFIVE